MCQGAGFDPETRTGMFQLAPGSKGVDAAVVIPNFCEDGQREPAGYGCSRIRNGENAIRREGSIRPAWNTRNNPERNQRTSRIQATANSRV